ncbi:MAG: sigma-70 family RNA polymerase sigma factor [Bryobacteraceae bacterium]|nr:sigma-70 family RNA polymerase sigma factor [Bryobacteraceae bacterium]
MMTADTERPALFTNVEGAMIQAVQLDRVRTALARLTDRQRQLIELAYFEGLTQTEMADRIQQPLGTVKTWMRGALKVLREELTTPETA